MTESIVPVTGSPVRGSRSRPVSPLRPHPAPPPAGPPDFAALAQAAARHGITILAPPPQP